MCVCVIIQYCPKESLTIPNVEQILDLQTSKYEEQNEWPILDLREGILSMSFFKVRWWKRKDISKSKQIAMLVGQGADLETKYTMTA